VVNADIREPENLWEQAFATHVLDRKKPVAVLMFALLHTLRPDLGANDPAAKLAARYRDLIQPGSYLGISHITSDGVPAELPDKLASLRQLFKDMRSEKTYCRTRAAIGALLGDFEMLDPGMVWIPQWHPDTTDVTFPAPNHSTVWAGVGRKR
jgi:hypothetical protein